MLITFYDLERFSVDLDFDLLDTAKEDLVFNGVQKILEQYGNIKEARKKKFNLFYLMSYRGKKPDAQNVKVEINRRDFGSKYEVRPYLGISMKVMAQDDMAAHKLIAMIEKLGNTNRDIFDVWFFLKNNWPINENIIKNRTDVSLKNLLQRCIDGLENLDNRNILSGMGELLNEKQKNWARTNLKKDTLFLLKLRLELEKER